MTDRLDELTDALLNADATAQAAAIRDGSVSRTALVAAALARIDERNPTLNAVIHHRPERALEEVAAMDPTLPFAGVPIVVKDLGLTMAGEPLHMGTQYSSGTATRLLSIRTHTKN